jgi:hypothetical protein
MTALIEWLSNSGAAVLVASLLSLAALLLSLLAYLTSRKALRIEEARERDRQAGARRAALRARLVGTGLQEFLLLENSGQAEARDIEVRLDGTLFRDHPVAFKDESEFGPLGPGSEARYPIKLFHGVPSPPFELELTWRDDSGVAGRYRTTLTPTY